MPRTAAAQTSGAGSWVTNRAANGLHQAGTSLEEFFALQPGDVLAPEMAKVMYNLEGRARQDNMNKLAGRKGTAWKASKLTASEKAYVWAKSRGKCSHRFCKDPWIKLHYKKGTPNRLTIDHIQPKAKFPELTWMLDNWCLMCPQDNSLKGTRDDFTDEVYQEIEQTMKRMQMQ